MNETLRPSARIRLSVRFEEFADQASLLAQADGAAQATQVPSAPVATPEQAREQMLRVDADLRALNQRRGSLSSGVYDQSVRALNQRREALQDIVLGTANPASVESGSQFVFVVQSVVNVSIERNSFRDADTAEFELAFEDAPFDPRLFRAALVEITVGFVRPEQYERGMRGELRQDGSLMSIVQESNATRSSAELEDQSQGFFDRAESSTRFVGVIDEWKVEYSVSDGNKITAKCRDLSALLHDQPLDSNHQMSLTLPISEAAREMFKAYPSLRNTPVRFGDPRNPPTPVEGEDGVVAPADPGPILAEKLQLRRARRGRVCRQPRSGDQQQSVWDHLVEVCQRGGLMPVFYDYVLWISTPRSLIGSETRVIRRQVFGQNLEHLEFSRKLQGQKVPTIEVRCNDRTLGRTRWARYPRPDTGPASGIIGVVNPPDKPQRISNASPPGWAPSETIQTVIVNGNPDAVYMEEIARQYFEQTGRSEIEGNFKTHAFESVNSAEVAQSFKQFDLLNLDPGDGVEIGVMRRYGLTEDQLAATDATQIASMEVNARAQYLRQLGFDANVAMAYSRLYQSSGVQSFFRVRNVKLNFDPEDGLEIEADFQNFVVVREEPNS